MSGTVVSLLFAWSALAVSGSTPAFVEGLLSSTPDDQVELYTTDTPDHDWGWLFTETRHGFAISAIRKVSVYNSSDNEIRWKNRSIPGWAHTRDIEARADQYVINFAVGWPMRSLSAYVLQPTPGSWVVHGGIEVPGLPIGAKNAGPSRLTLPFTPHPLGLLVNALIFAAFAYVIAAVFRIIQVYVRRSRMQCPRCAYDIRGLSTCPECGEVVIPRDGKPGRVSPENHEHLPEGAGGASNGPPVGKVTVHPPGGDEG